LFKKKGKITQMSNFVSIVSKILDDKRKDL